MPLISRDSIDEIKNNINIHDVVSPYCNLKKTGVHFRGLSPFTNEKTPSFFIHPDKNVFKCFSTGNAGDIFRFVQLKENLNFQEAVETLARRFNIQLKYEASNQQTIKQVSLRKELLEIHEVAKDFYHQSFLDNTPHASFAQQYWINNRQFPLDLAKELKIGFAPVSDNKLIQLLRKKGFSYQAIENSGLFYSNKNNPNHQSFKPRFRGRLMIPIRDLQSRVIAFTARQLDITPKDDPSFEAKYINSPETLIFIKGQTLFGIDRARQNLADDSEFLLVEGQLDAIRCWQYGINTAIAPQGTAITDAQMILLKRYASKVNCVLDSDKAGINATLRLLPIAFKAGLDVSILQLPNNTDPDTFLLNHGIDSFNNLLKEKIDAMTFAVHQLAPNGTQSSPTQKMDTLRNIMDLLKDSDSLPFIQSSLKYAGQLLGLYENVIDKEILQFHLKKSPNERNNIANVNEKLTSAEYQLLLLLLHNEQVGKPIAEILNPEWINSQDIHGILLNRILAEIREDLWQGINNIDTLLENDQERNCIYSLLAEQTPFESPTQVANLCIHSLYQSFYNKAKHNISNKIASLAPNQTEELHELQRKRIHIRRLLEKSPKIKLSEPFVY